MTKTVLYPTYKKVAYRVSRVFADGAIAAITTEALLQALNMELDIGIKYLIMVALTGGLAGLTKHLREKAASYDDLVHRLPV